MTRPSLLFVTIAALALSGGCGLSEFPLDPVTSATVDAGSTGSPSEPVTMPPMSMPGGDAARPPVTSTPDAGAGDGTGPGPRDTAPMGQPPDVSPPAAGTITIGGKSLTKEDVVVFLHIGHSNMAGRTNTPAALRAYNFETHPQLWAYAKGGSWRPAKEPLSGDYLTENNAGPGMSILQTALKLAPNRTIVSIGRGHDGSIGGHCRNFRKGALLYDFVMAPAMELKGKVTFGAIFTMLGVNEFRRDAANLTKFHECLAGIASDMRTDLGDPNIPFVLGDWEAGATGAFDPTRDYAVTTKAQIRMAAANIPRSVLIPTEMLPMTDDHHYDLTGYKMWAERGFDLLQKAQLLPWASGN
ncbi:MAG TPA: sialate O-acetylesterase [Polyangia bacterium]